MRTRLVRLECFAVQAKDRLSHVEAKLDRVDKKIGRFKWWIAAQIVATLLTVLGMVYFLPRSMA